MESFINTVNGIVWSPALVYLCLGAGLFLSLRGGFLQLRHLKHMWQLLFQPKDNVTGVSSFQALSMTLAGRVGTGNIAGVATAITFGGPGAIFWMWMVAFLGASSAFVESTLGQVYKEKINGEYRGGPAFYIERGLGIKWFAWLFAIRHHLLLRSFPSRCAGKRHCHLYGKRLRHRSSNFRRLHRCSALLHCVRRLKENRSLHNTGRALHGSGLCDFLSGHRIHAR